MTLRDVINEFEALISQGYNPDTPVILDIIDGTYENLYGLLLRVVSTKSPEPHVTLSAIHEQWSE